MKKIFSHISVGGVGVGVALVSLAASIAMTSVANAAGPWFVSPAGSDANDCLSTGTACLTIQAAINKASSGDTVNVATGTYVEQVSISKSLTLTGVGASFSTIQLPASGLTPDTDGTIDVVAINGLAAVTVSGFTITGPGPSGCNSINYGIYVRGGAVANIHDNTINNIQDTPFSGCQNGVGIQVGRNAAGTTGTATITNNHITNYQKNGIAVDNTGSSATITGNTVTGIGSTISIAQNGIEIARGATGTISNNIVSGNEYSATIPGNSGGPDPINDVRSAGIILYQIGGGVTVSSNTVSDSDMGLYNLLLGDGTTTIASNTFTNNRYAGIEFDQGNAAITGNHITGSAIGIAGLTFGGAGGDTENSNALVLSNVINGATDSGIKLLEDSATDTFTPTLIAHMNDLSGNATGTENDVALLADATCNWWGAANGPGPVGTGSGDGVSSNVTFLPWLGSSNLNGPCSGGQPVTVTLVKYLDGAPAASSTATSSFPMLATWDAANIGSGSGGFALSPTGFNNPNPYEATTANMDQGASYSAVEDLSGASVKADCSAGNSFALTGYSTGSTLVAAASSTVSTTTPAFTNMTNSEYIVVWNHYCLPAPTLLSPANGTVTSTANLTSVNWNSVTDPAGGIAYVYQASNSSTTNPDGSFTSPVYTSVALATTTLPTPGTPDGVYYWHVQATDGDGNVSLWSTTWTFTVAEPPALLQVHILKYLDGVEATASSTGGYLFPMVSTWTAANLNGGATSSGNYVLGANFGGAADLYGADTAAMAAPANYTTSEVTNDADPTSKVLPEDAVCTAGMYQLKGYQASAVSFADAASSTMTNDPPDFTGLASDQYVIVDNATCPTTGTLVVEKDTIGGDGTFSFTSPDLGVATFTLTTASGTASRIFAGLLPGTYHVTEAAAAGWTQTDTECSSVVVGAGPTSTCIITNTKNTKLGEIRGFKFEDWDGDGSPYEKKWEVKLSGWTIYLDANNNGVLDPNESSTVTNAFGEYTFKNLPAGTYHVREVQKPGWIGITPASGVYNITLGAGKIAKNKNFGNFKLGTITGQKFYDKDGDSRKDHGEVGLANWTIKITGPHGFSTTTLTNASGTYSFTNLGPGKYTVTEVQQPGWVQTTKNPKKITIDSASVVKGIDFGNQHPADKKHYPTYSSFNDDKGYGGNGFGFGFGFGEGH